MRSVSLPGSCKGHSAPHQLSLSTYIPRNSIPGECSDTAWLQQRQSAVVLHTQLAFCASFSSCPPVLPCSELHFMTEPRTGNLLLFLHLQKQQEHEDHHVHRRCCSSTKAWHRVGQPGSYRETHKTQLGSLQTSLLISVSPSRSLKLESCTVLMHDQTSCISSKRNMYLFYPHKAYLVVPINFPWKDHVYYYTSVIGSSF